MTFIQNIFNGFKPGYAESLEEAAGTARVKHAEDRNDTNRGTLIIKKRREAYVAVASAALTTLAAIWIKDDRRFLFIGLAIWATVTLGESLWKINEYMKEHFKLMQHYSRT